VKVYKEVEPKKIMLLGGGGHASDVLGLLEEINSTSEEYLITYIFDSKCDSQRFLSRNVCIEGDIGTVFDRMDLQDTFYVAAVGYPQARMSLVKQALQLKLIVAKALVHPTGVSIGTGVVVGDGTVILANTSISPNVRIGDHCYLSHGCMVGHDSVINDGCSIMPGASISGDVTLGERVLVGAGAVVLQGLTIADDVQIGANAVVTKNVKNGTTVIGIPAQPMKQKYVTYN